MEGMTIYDIKEYNPSSMDSYLFDNNIWMFLFCPIGNTSLKKQKVYSNFLQAVTTCRATIFVTSMILSEFANACLRLDCELWKKDVQNYGKDYKRDYRKSEHYKMMVKTIISSIKTILKIAKQIPDDFNSINIENILISFEKRDFNDSYYIELCKSKSLKMVTDDRDFRDKELTGLTVISII